MQGFKQFMTQQPPAFLKKAENPFLDTIQNTIKAIPEAEKILIQIVDELITESVSTMRLKYEVPHVLESDQFKSWVSSNFGNIKPMYGSSGYIVKCGEDSCAYFFTKNYIFKFLGGKSAGKEYTIAQSIQGKLKIVPIVKTAEFEFTGSNDNFLCIVMKKVDEQAAQLNKAVREAASLVSENMYVLQHKVEKNPETPIEYIRKRLTVKYMMKHYSGSITYDLVEKAVTDLMNTIKIVYKKSGYLIGADLQNARNVGLTKSDKIMIFDYGRPDKHPLMAATTEKPASNYIEIPENMPR